MDIERERDVVIVGAGPAGAGAAFFLARQGLDVLFIEAKDLPRPKPCGDGIGPRAVLALREMGLKSWLDAGDHRQIKRLRIVASSGASIASAAEPSLFPITSGYVIARDKFDHKLATHAVEAGADLLTGCPAWAFLDDRGQEHPGLPERVTGVVVTLDSHKHRVAAKLTVLADGSKGRLSRLANRGAPQARAVGLRAYAAGVAGIDDCVNIYFNRRFPNGYSWVFPTGPATANIGVGLLGANHNLEIKQANAAFDYFRHEQDLTPLSLRHCAVDKRPVGSTMQTAFGRRLIQQPGLACLGDAAGLVSPLNGEGISHALESAQLLATHLDSQFTSTNRIDKALVGFEAALRRRYIAYFRWANFLSRFLARPRRLDRLVLKAQRDDYLRIILTGVLTNTVHPREFARLRVMAKMISPPVSG